MPCYKIVIRLKTKSLHALTRYPWAASPHMPLPDPLLTFPAESQAPKPHPLLLLPISGCPATQTEILIMKTTNSMKTTL